ncbi:hypothetical protein C9374_014180 [Naegleria lovaniensis]|uniref:Protein kinase domain-containing protein n=1 Tax=Naegleria lovaniensis TaxID=51637 RepID=A0AA88KN34_NAELO|nr:uncharacterized protein C9374_014180 [Naegleria lovaniensis]KAG2389620.1 hypothetical protein C9374_014180 [Naegleria lovaniensis]
MPPQSRLSSSSEKRTTELQGCTGLTFNIRTAENMNNSHPNKKEISTPINKKKRKRSMKKQKLLSEVCFAKEENSTPKKSKSILENKTLEECFSLNIKQTTFINNSTHGLEKQSKDIDILGFEYTFTPEEYDGTPYDGKTVSRGVLRRKSLQENDSLQVYWKTCRAWEWRKTSTVMSKMRTLYVVCGPDNSLISVAGIGLPKIIRCGMKGKEVQRMICDILCQMVILESKNMIHNDVKPQNIVKYDNHYYLIDFEISETFDECIETDARYECKRNGKELTCKSYSKGYRAPERDNEHKISPKSDVYSLGLVILECFRLSQEDCCNKSKIEECLQEQEESSRTLKEFIDSSLKEMPNERLAPKQLLRKLFSVDKTKETLRYFADKEGVLREHFPAKEERTLYEDIFLN